MSTLASVTGIQYDQLTKWQKLALFMIVLGPESASQLLKNFDDAEIEAICQEMSKFPLVDSALQIQVIEDFSEIIGDSVGALLGGSIYAQNALELAKGDYRAADIIGRIAPTDSTTEVIDEMGEMEARQIFNLVRGEQSQTIAFLLCHLSTEKASQILGMLDTETRDAVVERIGTMESTSMELVGKVVGNLRRHFSGTGKHTSHQAGGVRAVANLLNVIDKETSKALLQKLEERNPQLGQAIRKKMFSFEDLTKLEAPDLQRILREVEISDLVISMKSASAALQKAILDSVSKRAAETMQEEIEMLGPVKLKDVEAAQDRIISVVRRLEEEGEITIDSGGGTRVIE